MAPRQTTKRSSAPPPPRRASHARSQADEITDAEMHRSRKSAILQLDIGRLAHILGIASGLALAATAVVAYLQENWSWLADAPAYVISLNWLVPLIASVVVAAVAMYIKWEPYFADRADPHFLMSIVAVAVPSLFIALIALDETGYMSIGRPTWLYPASLLGISLTMVSLAMTWEGTGRRKVISIASAAFPPVLLIFPVIFSFTPEELSTILPMAYLGSAVAIQLSGSMMHIIASSTSVQQREVLKASDGKLREIVVDVEKKREALEYREDALRMKESDLEADLKRLSEELASAEETKKQIVGMEAEIEQRLIQARTSRQELTKTEVGVENKLENLKLKQADLDAQAKEVERRLKAAASRDERIAAKEVEANKLMLDAQVRDRESKNRLADAHADEMSLGIKANDLKALDAALVEREKQIRVREGALDLKGLEVFAAKEQLGKAAAEKTTVKTLEQQLLIRQEALSEREVKLRAKEDELRRESEKATRLITRADKQMNELVDKEGVILAREKAVSDGEARLRTALVSMDAQLEDVQRAKTLLSDREHEYVSMSEGARAKLAEMAGRDEETARRMSSLDRREEMVKDLDRRLKTEQERMTSKLKELLEAEKDLKAHEAEIGLKHAELKAMERQVLEQVEQVSVARSEMPGFEAFGTGSDERSKTLDMRERSLREKEQETKSRFYLREKELEKRERLLQVKLKKDIEEMEEQVQEEFAEEKVKTGVERLDDLMLGGMPFASNVLYVGPPFIGKETAALLFMAEGLRKGVPVVVVTTSHPPGEIELDVAPILPSFKEFEQLGLVRWVDATGAQVEGQTSRANAIKVKGPGDFDGILHALDGLMKQFERDGHPYFRLVYTSLSLSITQADDKQSFQFVQNIAGRIRQARAVAVYAVERGMHTEQQLESIQHQMTGALMFKTEKQKTMLCVQGVTDAQTRDWVDYRHTNKALMVGAFSLERIR